MQRQQLPNSTRHPRCKSTSTGRKSAGWNWSKINVRYDHCRQSTIWRDYGLPRCEPRRKHGCSRGCLEYPAHHAQRVTQTVRPSIVGYWADPQRNCLNPAKIIVRHSPTFLGGDRVMSGAVLDQRSGLLPGKLVEYILDGISARLIHGIDQNQRRCSLGLRFVVGKGLAKIV